MGASLAFEGCTPRRACVYPSRCKAAPIKRHGRVPHIGRLHPSSGKGVSLTLERLHPSSGKGVSLTLEGCIHQAAWACPSRWKAAPIKRHGRVPRAKRMHASSGMDVSLTLEGCTHQAAWACPSRQRDAPIKRHGRVPRAKGMHPSREGGAAKPRSRQEIERVCWRLGGLAALFSLRSDAPIQRQGRLSRVGRMHASSGKGASVAFERCTHQTAWARFSRWKDPPVQRRGRAWEQP